MYITSDRRYIVVSYNEALARAIPHAKAFTYGHQKLLAINNDRDEARVARNLGVAMPPPIETIYDWRKSSPWKIQRTTAALLAESPRCYVLSELGTGKTRSVLYAADYLMQTRQAKRMLVVAPLSTLTPVWERECFQLMLPYRVNVLHGTKERRLRLLNEGTPICVVNHHGVQVLGDEIMQAGFDIVVLDELAIYRNKRTELWKWANYLVNNASTRWVWGLTGAPTPNDATDAWAQVRLMTPNRTTRTFSAFRDMTMRRITTFKWVPRPEANAIVFDSMRPSVRFTRSEVAELPPCITVEREAPLDVDAAKAYKLMYTRARMLCEQSGESITAVNEGVLQGKLLQVSCGFVYTDSKTVYAMPASRRLAALDEIIAESSHKLIVMVPFLHALNGVADYLRARKHNIATVSGSTGRTARDKIFTDFQQYASPRIIVAHPGCLAHGLTLTAADTIVWYSPTTSLEIYDQANGRINRPGQKNKMMIVHLVGSEVERITYTRLRTKQRMQGCLLELFAKRKEAF